jgi:hypothetical protein
MQLFGFAKYFFEPLVVVGCSLVGGPCIPNSLFLIPYSLRRCSLLGDRCWLHFQLIVPASDIFKNVTDFQIIIPHRGTARYILHPISYIIHLTSYILHHTSLSNHRLHKRTIHHSNFAPLIPIIIRYNARYDPCQHHQHHRVELTADCNT